MLNATPQVFTLAYSAERIPPYLYYLFVGLPRPGAPQVGAARFTQPSERNELADFTVIQRDILQNNGETGAQDTQKPRNPL